MKEEESLNYSYTSHLMELVRQGDEHAFSLLFTELWKPLYTRALVLLDSDTVAQDVVQEVWIDFWKRRKQIQNKNIEAYLYKAVTFKVYKELRDTKFSTSQLEILEKIAAPSSPGEKLHLADTQNKVDEALKELPYKCREVFELSRFKGLKNAEISSRLDISQRTVETHISKALKLMRKKLSYFLSFL